MSVRLPNSTQRTAVVGSTGSGKTTGAVWLLSKVYKPGSIWLIVDFKGDKLIARIPGLKEIRVTDNPPRKPGIYVVRPLPDDHAELDELLYKCWLQEDIGIYIDEGLMVGKNGRSRWMRALLTQGRSKHIPMIILTQRPVWCDKFILTESDFLWTFRLNNADDRNTVQGQVSASMEQRLAPYHSYWYDVASDRLSVFAPVPSDREILSAFQHKTKRPKRMRVA